MLALQGFLRVSVLAAVPSGLKEGCLLHGGPVCFTAWNCRLPPPSQPSHTLTPLITEMKAGEEVLQVVYSPKEHRVMCMWCRHHCVEEGVLRSVDGMKRDDQRTPSHLVSMSLPGHHSSRR